MDMNGYQWTDEERKFLTDFGLVPTSRTDHRNILWTYEDANDPTACYMAKRIEKGSYEDKALHKIYSLSSPRNPVVPGRLLESENACVFLMPLLRSGFIIDRRFVTWPVLTRHIYTIIDGLQFLHENNMAFIDVTVPNWVFSLEPMKIKGFDVPGDSIYFIDFEATRILPSGPGSGVKIRDYEQKSAAPPHPPEGMDNLDPYAVDIFKLGGALEWFLELYPRPGLPGPPVHVPSCLTHFAKALQHENPAKRPSIFRVRRQFSALRVWMSCTSWMYRVFGEKFGDSFGLLGWKIISTLVP